MILFGGVLVILSRSGALAFQVWTLDNLGRRALR